MSNLWTEKEINQLVDMYEKKVSVKEISEILGRPHKSIRSKAYNLKITHNTHFTKEELDFIKRNYDEMNIKELAEKLGRGKNWQNVCRAAKKLGLTGNKKTVRHPDRPEPIVRTNKYKTDEERREANSIRMKEWHKNHEHPKGMKGKTHNKEYKEWRSRYMKDQWEDQNSVFNSDKMRDKKSIAASKAMKKRMKEKPSSIYTKGRGGKRKDLGIYVRSSWEANFARYLNFLVKNGSIHKWDYEPDTFWFENIKRGTRSYTPDFKIWEKEHSTPFYYEVKGYMDSKSKTKLKRMAKYHPDVEIKLIQEKEYKEISKFKEIIPNWE